MEALKYLRIFANDYAKTFMSYMLRNKCKVRSDDFDFFFTENLPAHDNPYYFKETSSSLTFSSIE